MAKSARLVDVARLAGVSPGLVSRLVNEDSHLRIREDTRKRITSAIEMLQYTPHASARALRRSETGLLGFALHNVTDPIYAQMVDAAESAAADKGYSVLLLSAEKLMNRSDMFRRVVQGRRIDGLFLQSGYADDALSARDMYSLPLLVFNADATPGFRTVRLDDSNAARVATEHLIELGHTKIAFVGATGASSVRRYQGYLDAMNEVGLTSHPMVVGGWNADSARTVIDRYFASGGSATGLVVVSTTSALGVHAGVTARGLSIPRDVSIVSIHDAWFAQYLSPALTAVAIPFGSLGALAVDMLVEQMASPSAGETVLSDPPPTLIRRGSTGAAPPE